MAPHRLLRHFEILSALGVEVPKRARILDFGCGAGDTVKGLREAGYVNTEGYEIEFDGVSMRSRERPAQVTLGTQLDLRVPFPDNTFDVVISDQVFEHVQDQFATLKEVCRIMKPGACALHLFPARYRPLEGHIFVPFGSVFGHRWYYKFWALLGIRNQFQKGLSADEVADRNALFFVQGLRYIPTSCYKAVFREIGFTFKMANQEYFDSHRRGVMRLVGKANRLLPIFGWLHSVFASRVAYLVKA